MSVRSNASAAGGNTARGKAAPKPPSPANTNRGRGGRAPRRSSASAGTDGTCGYDGCPDPVNEQCYAEGERPLSCAAHFTTGSTLWKFTPEDDLQAQYKSDADFKTCFDGAHNALHNSGPKDVPQPGHVAAKRGQFREVWNEYGAYTLAEPLVR